VDRCTKKADVTDNDWSIRSNQDGSRTGYDAAEGASQVADWLTQETLGDCLPCQQRYSGRHQKSGDPAAAIHFFMQEDFRGKGVTDEGE
jgi:hypothetical protein